MSKIVLAVVAILLLTGPLGLADSPSCQMSDLAQAASLGDIVPCPDSEQSVNHNVIRIHNCDCSSLLLPDTLLDTVVNTLAPLSFVATLQPQTAVLAPLAPPPRFI